MGLGPFLLRVYMASITRHDRNSLPQIHKSIVQVTVISSASWRRTRPKDIQSLLTSDSLNRLLVHLPSAFRPLLSTLCPLPFTLIHLSPVFFFPFAPFSPFSLPLFPFICLSSPFPFIFLLSAPIQPNRLPT